MSRRTRKTKPAQTLDGGERLQKVLANAGVASRRHIDELIALGRVRVDGRPGKVGQHVAPGARILLDGKPLSVPHAAAPPRVLLYHKPVGEIVTRDDPAGRPTPFEHLPRLTQGQWISVGRLDINSSGLLVFTSSGELANNLMHPRYGFQREYAVRVRGALSDAECNSLLGGIKLEDGVAKLDRIEFGGGQGSNHWYRVTLHEGRNREVRRIFESIGHTVSRLMRIKFGPLALSRNLRPGRFQELSTGDVEQLLKLVHVVIENVDAARKMPNAMQNRGEI